jgi:hypothetical protein
MSGVELKPCPFCGSHPRFYAAQVMIDGDCPESIDCINEDCLVSPSTGYMPINEAIAAWNARQLASPLTISDLAFLAVLHATVVREGYSETAIATAEKARAFFGGKG